MPLTDVEICSIALTELGDEPIESFSDDRQIAVIICIKDGYCHLARGSFLLNMRLFQD